MCYSGEVWAGMTLSAGRLSSLVVSKGDKMDADQLSFPFRNAIMMGQNTSGGRFPRERRNNGSANKMAPEDAPVHEWYRFVLSFPPHLVREYLAKFGIREGHLVLDPFCGTGTTLVECKKLGVASVGIEAHPLAHFAAATKTDWSPRPDALAHHARRVAQITLDILHSQGIWETPVHSAQLAGEANLRALNTEAAGLLLAGSISPIPLHRTLVLLDAIASELDPRYTNHEKLALAQALVSTISNLHFGPEVGVGPAKVDSPVVKPWLDRVSRIAADLSLMNGNSNAPAAVILSDAREIPGGVPLSSVDAVFTSPPYPNEKDYTRTTRLESVLLGFVSTKEQLRALKQSLLRSNTRNVYKGDDDDAWIGDFPEISDLAEEIERRRQRLGKTSGFERLYPRVTLLYFGGMARHLASLRKHLRPGAFLGYVVGDQASYLRVMIRTGQLLARVATSLGYELVDIDLFRTRMATATREQLREEVVVLRWPG